MFNTKKRESKGKPSPKVGDIVAVSTYNASTGKEEKHLPVKVVGVGEYNGQAIPILDIPMMTEERERELFQEQMLYPAESK